MSTADGVCLMLAGVALRLPVRRVLFVMVRVNEKEYTG